MVSDILQKMDGKIGIKAEEGCTLAKELVLDKK